MDELLLTLDFELVANAARTEFMGGREYLVRDAVILREGVLNGSDGPLYYPLNEINQDIGVWNGMPLVAPHPMATDPSDGKLKPISARSPQTLNKYGVGFVFNDRMKGGDRQVEVWFDVQNANRVDPRIIPKIKSGDPVNVSTGIFTKRDKPPTDNAPNHNGKSYTHVVRAIKPDHLAVLIDDRGACSIDDGCGINLTKNKANYPEKCPYCGTSLEIDPDSGVCNRCGKKVAPVTNSSEDPTVNKDQLVNWLTVNCDCWKTDKSKEVLNSLDLNQLEALKTNAEKAKVADPLKSLVINLSSSVGFKDSDPLKLSAFITNSLSEKDKKIKELEDKSKVTPPLTANGEGVTKDQVLNALKGMPEKEVLELFPVLNQTVETAKGVVDKERIAIMHKLVANAKSDEEKKAKLLKLKDKTLPQLSELLEFATLNAETPAAPTSDEQFLANFFGAQGGGDSGGKGSKTPPTDNRPLLPSLNMYHGAGEDEVVEEVA